MASPAQRMVVILHQIYVQEIFYVFFLSDQLCENIVLFEFVNRLKNTCFISKTVIVEVVVVGGSVV